MFCELRSTGLQLTISQLEYRAATQRQISGSGQEIQINTEPLQEDIFQRSAEEIRHDEFLKAPIAQPHDYISFTIKKQNHVENPFFKRVKQGFK